MEPRPVYIFTALHQEAKAIRPVVGRRPGAEVRVIGLRAAVMPALDGLPARAIIVAGFGGALDPSLNVGDIVIDGWPAFEGPKWLRFGAIHSADHLVATAEERSRLFRQSGALAVDMETAIVRRAAAGIPVIAVRAITDTAAQDVDPALLGLLNDQGRVRGGALVGMLLRRPARVRELLRLRAAARMAGRRLGDAIRIILDRMM